MQNSKKLKQALTESEKLFRLLFDAIEDAVIVFEVLPDGSRGLIRDVNTATCRRLGYSKEELQQMTVAQIDAPESGNCEVPVSTRYAKGAALFETIHQAKDGTKFFVEVNAKKLEYNGRQMILAIARDISARKQHELIKEKYLETLGIEVSRKTDEIQKMNQSLRKQVEEKKQAEAKARKAEKDIRSLIDASNQSIFMNDQEGNILYANKNIANEMGLSPEELVGKNIYEMISPELAKSRLTQLAEAAKTGRPIKYKDERAGKKLFHTIYPVIDQHKITKFAHYTEDLSEILEKDAELEKSRQIQSILFQIISHSQSSTNLEELLQSIHKIMGEELRADNFFIGLLDDDKKRLKFEYCFDQTNNHCSTIHNIDSCKIPKLCLLPIIENKAVLLHKAQIQKMCDNDKIIVCGKIPEVWLGLPLTRRGVPIGVIVTQHYSNPDIFTDDDLRIFSACSDQIAIAIERSKFNRVSKSARDTFHNIPSGLCIYKHTRHTTFKLLNSNPASQNELNKPIKDFITKGLEKRDYPPDAKHFFSEIVSPVTQGDKPVTREFTYEDKGEERTFQLNSFRLPGQKLGIAFNDITEQTKAEIAIRESEEQFRAFFEDNHSVMFIIEPFTGKILETNKAAAHFYGQSRTELKSKHVFELNALPPSEVKSLMQKAKGQVINNFIFKHRTAGNIIKNVEVFSGPFKFRGKTRLISIVHDITERVENERLLSKAKEEAIQANKSKDEFIANISHEIRTPLNGVMGMLQLMQSSNISCEQKGNIEIALQSSRNLLRVLDDILDFSRLEVGTLEIINTPFCLQSLMDECLDLFKFQADDKGIDLAGTIKCSGKGKYIGDEVRIRQILFNLVGNAIKFTDKGAVTLTIQPTPAEKNKMELNFSISDTGIGIPENKIESIFNSFTQVDGSLSRKYQGSGLGLAIVKRLLCLMDGTIEIDSILGKGTTIEFTLKLERSEQKANCNDKKEAEKNCAPLKILLVEDEPVNRMMARKILEKMGHTIICAENGHDCLQRLGKECVDLVFMDIQMPVMDGIETTRLIRNDEQYRDFKKIPIVALSAHAAEKDKKMAYEAGVNGYVCKPFVLAELKSIVSEVSTNIHTKIRT